MSGVESITEARDERGKERERRESRKLNAQVHVVLVTIVLFRTYSSFPDTYAQFSPSFRPT